MTFSFGTHLYWTELNQHWAEFSSVELLYIWSHFITDEFYNTYFPVYFCEAALK